MPVKYHKQKRKIVVNSTIEERFVPKMQLEAPVDFEQIAEMIEKKSTMSRGDIMGVLAELEITTCFMLENGHPVTLGLMGTFYPTIETESVLRAEDVTSKLIKRFRILFKPSTYLKKRLKHISFVLGDNNIREVKSRK
jgi:predicted histone-like DNA-binding protein